MSVKSGLFIDFTSRGKSFFLTNMFQLFSFQKVVSTVLYLNDHNYLKQRSPLNPQAGWPDRYINVRCCGGLSIWSSAKDPLELFVKRMEFLPGFGFLYDIFLPSFLLSEAGGLIR